MKNRFLLSFASARRLAGLCLAGVCCAFASQATATPGELYVTDLSNGSVVVYAPDGSKRTFKSGFTSPQGIAFDQGKNLYVADAGDGSAGAGVIHKYNLAGAEISGSGFPLTGLSNPIGVTLDGSDILVAENGADRVLRVPLNGGAVKVFRTVTAPQGLDSHAFNQLGFTKFIADGPEVLKITPDGVATDIDPDDGSRGIVADDAGDVFISTDAGQITKVTAGGTISAFVTGYTDPHGLVIKPKIVTGTTLVYVADTMGHEIFQVTATGISSSFVTGGNPNYLVFETNSTSTPTPTPTPSPTATPSPTITPAPTPTPAPKALNLSTRVDVRTGDKVGIGGFIVSGGSTAKTVAIRGIGPSLANGNPPVASPLANPFLELHEPDGTIVTNDDWMDNSPADKAIINSRGLNPSDPRESVIIATLPPLDPAVNGSGIYTAVIRGSGGGSGVALVEVYDLDDASANAQLANISTRGFVGTGDNVLIGGLIVGPAQNDLTGADIAVRAIGPSLANATPPVQGVLANPFLEIHNADGDTIDSNDDWQDSPDNGAAIAAVGLAPEKAKESALLEKNLLPGIYTAIVSGVNNTTGVALVEFYHTESSTPAAK